MTIQFCRSIAFASLVAVVGAGCAAGGGGPADATNTPVEEYGPTIAPTENLLGACIDATPSVDPALVMAGIDQIAAITRALPTPTVGAEEARSPVAGLMFVLRQVSANSMASVADELISMRVPGVPGLVAPPDPAEFRTFADRNPVWDEALARSDQAVVDAQQAREEMLGQLSSVTPIGETSEIAGCLSALRDSFPVGDRFVAVLISDLEQTSSPQIRGDFGGMQLVVAHACSAADRCDQTEAEWRVVLEDMGVASVVFVSVQQLEHELLKLLEVE